MGGERESAFSRTCGSARGGTLVVRGKEMTQMKRIRDPWATQELEHLARESGEPRLQRELQRRDTAGYHASRGFRKAWDRLMVAVGVGR